MQFITDLVLGVIVAYIGFTNSLADKILALVPEEEVPSAITEDIEAAPEITQLPSRFEGGNIPDLLRRNLSFQSAAVGDTSSINTFTSDPLEALVNIFCTFTTPDYIRTTTGTGFFVHSDGVILTNAHVAQYLLLSETELLGEAECIVRQGNPASIAYKANLLYLPPSWVQQNAAVIDASTPSGTGERDYALLYVSESLTGEPLPAIFPALPVETELLSLSAKNETVTAAGYPATDLIKNGASTPLIPRQAETTISELYTFGSNYADVISITGSAVGAEGSSGGPVLNSNGKAIGMIVTRGDDETDGVGSLRAISLSHIDRTIEEETGFILARNISGNLPRRSEIFMETLAPFLLTLLSTELRN